MNTVCLIIADGWGEAPPGGGNAISQAKTPNFQYLLRHAAHTTLKAAGPPVGLPIGAPGNSEVGHLNLGCGRVPNLDINRINQAIADQSFFSLDTLTRAIAQIKAEQRPVHLVGLLSTETIHGNYHHLLAVSRALFDSGIKSHFVHLIADGRDTPPHEGVVFANRLKQELAALGGIIATVTGRYYAMDRDQRWERTQVAYQCIVLGQGEAAHSAEAAFADGYRKELTDEFLPGYIIGNPSPITSDAAVIFTNFRADRMRQLLLSLGDPGFINFERPPVAPLPLLVTMTDYFTGQAPVKIQVILPSIQYAKVLAEMVSQAGLKQLHIAETEKYAHISYFFNGAHEKPFPFEERVVIPSPKVATYDERPEMSSRAITERARAAIIQGGFSLIVINYANADMVGHTGNFIATIKAVEAVDQAIGTLRVTCEQTNTQLIMTADHGNAEEMLNPDTFEINPEHTINPVPCIVTGVTSLTSGALSSVAPLVLQSLGLGVPVEMTGTRISQIAPVALQ